MKILVTGGVGYMGSHTVLELVAAGHEVLSCDNYCNSSPEALARVRRLTNAPIGEAEVDVRDRSRLNELMADFRPDVVIHFAGIKAVGASGEVPARVLRHQCRRHLEPASSYGQRRLQKDRLLLIRNGLWGAEISAL